MVEMRRFTAFVVLFLLISPMTAAYGDTHVVNEGGSEYSFYFRKVISTSQVQYFLIEGSRNMEVSIHLRVEGTTLNHDPVSVYLVVGDYTMPEGSTEPDKYDDWHSHPSPTSYFNTNFIMSTFTTYTLVVIPNGSSSYSIEIEGENSVASFDMTATICVGMILIAVVIALVYFRIHGVIGRPRPVKFMKGRKKEERDEDSPYDVR